MQQLLVIVSSFFMGEIEVLQLVAFCRATLGPKEFFSYKIVRKKVTFAKAHSDKSTVLKIIFQEGLFLPWLFVCRSVCQKFVSALSHFKQWRDFQVSWHKYSPH